MKIDRNTFEFVDKNCITASSNISVWNGNGPDLILDDSEDTLFH